MNINNFLVGLFMILCLIMPGLAFIPPVPPIVHRGQSDASTPSQPLYQPTKAEYKQIAHCYFNRFWERGYLTELTENEAFCERLASNFPNYAEKQSNKFAGYRKVWKKISELASLPIWDELPQLHMKCSPYNLTSEEKQEIEDCYFSREWLTKTNSTLSAHEAFCKRVSANMPNTVETKGTAFQAYRQEWNNTTEAARDDLAQIIECVGAKDSHFCVNYYEKIDAPYTHRDIRRKEMHECFRVADREEGERKDKCVKLLTEYKELYYS